MVDENANQEIAKEIDEQGFYEIDGTKRFLRH